RGRVARRPLCHGIVVPVTETAPQQPEAETPDLPEAPVHPPVDTALSRVEMFEPGDLQWQPVSRALITTRTITLVAWLVPLLLIATVGAIWLTPWLWIPAGVLLVLL